ncbi:MAG: DUF1599 domain-containing protein [Bacteroides sp.]|nr:DUF1599 domain-containing protein [Bacteroides sp.]
MSTIEEYNRELEACRKVFSAKLRDYGASWRIMRPATLTDQMFIKAKRIRTLQSEEARVAEGVAPEFVALVNYGIMALIQLELEPTVSVDIDAARAEELYDKHAAATRSLMEAKNHDYGEAWRDMRVSSITDMILTKLLRNKEIEDNNGMTLVSEGVDGNYADIVNYAIFSLIHLTAEDEQRR